MEGSPGRLPNNSIIIADETGQINPLSCLSGLLTPNIGDWRLPNGTSLLDFANTPLDVLVGGDSSPGSITLLTRSPLADEHEGVYTCLMPDQNGEMQYLHVGLYLNGFSSK